MTPINTYMTLPSSGQITIAMIATELGVSLPLDLNASNVRTLAGKPTGNVVMPTDFYGKSSTDYVPNSFDVLNIIASGAFGSNYGEGSSNTVTVSGISGPINILFEFNDIYLNVGGMGQNGSAQIQVVKNTSTSAVLKTYSGTGNKANSSNTVSFASGDTFKITANYSVSGGTLGSNNGDFSATVNMKNASSGNTLLDSMTISVSVNEGGI